MLEINPAAVDFSNSRSYSGRIEVLERHSGRVWKVKAGFQVLLVHSANKLKPGTIVTGLITQKGNIFHLILSDKQDGVKSHPVFFDTNDRFLSRLSAFIISETGKKPDPLFASILEALVVKREILREHQAVLASHAYLRGFNSEASVARFIEAVSAFSGEGGGNRRGSGKRGDKGEPQKDVKDDIVTAVDSAESENSLVYLFNHIRVSEKHWVFVPFNTGQEKNKIKGSLRLCFVRENIAEIVIHAEKKGFEWFFHLSSLDVQEKKLRVFANRKGKAVLEGKKFALFAKKLQNLGVKIDDNIYDVGTFNGFSAVKPLDSVDIEV